MMVTCLLKTIAKATRSASHEFCRIHAEAVNSRGASLQTLASLALMISVGKATFTEIHQTVGIVADWSFLFFDKTLTSIYQAKRGCR